MFGLRAFVVAAGLVALSIAGANPVFAQESTPEATPGGETGSITISVYACPADLARTADQEPVTQAKLIVGCSPLDDPAVTPTLQLLSDGEPLRGEAIAPGVYRWEELALDSYVMGAENPPEATALYVTDADGSPLQNPVAILEAPGTEAEYAHFYFLSEATPEATPGAGTGAVTISVFACPADLARTADEEPVTQAELLAGCSPLDDPDAAPTLSAMPDGEPIAGEMTAPGVYRWDDLAVGEYVAGGEMPENMQGFRMSDAEGTPFQNPVVRVESAGSEGEYFFFHFLN